MGIVAVYTAIGQKSEKMKIGMILPAILHGCHQCLIFKEYTILNLLGDPCQFLIYDAARAHIQVSHLRISHLSIRKSHCQSTGIPLYKRAIPHQAVHHRSFRLCHCIPLCFVI